MLFNSIDYFVFLGLTLIGYWGLRRLGPERDVAVAVKAEPTGGVHPYRGGPRSVLRSRHVSPRFAFVLIASCVFYAAWNWRYLALIIFSTLVDYVVGILLGATTNERTRKQLLLVSLLSNLGLLGLFKYFNFFSAASGDILGLLGVDVDVPYLDLMLPVGISFYTFQTLSYSIDVYRGRLEPCRDWFRFACYVTFFPQLVAGPIVRAAELLPQLERPPWLDRDRVSRALFLISMGIIKKVVFADFIAVNLVDRVFDDPHRFSSMEVVIALYGFTLQIYADFSGYTDVARGSALLFGIELPRNFDRPYLAKSIPEFWRRWHMTLSTWLRDYLYFPLGGSRKGPLRTYLNLWITLFLIGLWHGASWTFVIYGNLQALAVVGTRAFGDLRKKLGIPPFPDTWWMNLPLMVLTLQFVVFSRILFRANDIENAGDIVTQLSQLTTSTAQVSDDVWRVLLLGFYLHYVPRSQLEWAWKRFLAVPAWGQGLVLVIVGIVALLFTTEQTVPFIYFQF